MRNTKIYTLFAGVNGAGKSTLFKDLSNHDFGVRLNSDEIIQNNKKDWRSSYEQLQAGKQVIEIRNRCIEEEISFNQETTLSGNSIINAIHKAKQHDFIINLYYVGVESVEIAKQRVGIRVKNGGHGIDESTIERRYYDSLSNLKEVIPLCDNIYLFDNSFDSIRKVFIKQENQVIVTDKNCKWLNTLTNNENKIKQIKRRI